MITLQPQQDFVILWENSDPLDTTTYYPQVVIRDAIDGTTLDTVSLALVAGSTSLYRYVWHAVADVSGAGRQINMTVKVYEDSGHLSLSNSKAIENRDYLVMDRLRHLGGGGSSGPDVDYKRIRTLLTEVVAAIPVPEPTIVPRTDLSPVIDAIRAIHIPDVQKPDLTPILDAITILTDHIGRVLAAVQALPKPEALKPILDKLDEIGADRMASDLSKSIESIRSVLGADVLDIHRIVEEMEAKFAKIPVAIMAGPMQDMETAPVKKARTGEHLIS